MNIHQLYAAIREDELRNQRSLCLTANESIMSATARRFLASELADRYYSGAGNSDGFNDSLPYFTSRGYPGVAALMAAAIDAAREMLGASEVNLSCLSGVHAMMCAILSTTDPGDAIMTLDLDHGGHFGTALIAERTGRRVIPAPYDPIRLSLDPERLAREFALSRAKALYLDASYYLSPHRVGDIRAALGQDAVIIYDASHTLGLIMGQQFEAPLREGADVLCGNTHKTLPGPHKGLIAFRDADLGERANGIINQGLYSTPHSMHMVALATTILEMRLFGVEYARQIIANADALGESLADKGLKIRRARNGRFSENHQVHLMTGDVGDSHMLAVALARSNITANFNNAFGGAQYIRFGTQEVTRRGMGVSEMRKIADLIWRSLKGQDCSGEVAQFVTCYQSIHYSFDEIAA